MSGLQEVYERLSSGVYAAVIIRTIICALLCAFLMVSRAGAVEPIKIGLTLGLTGAYAEICDLQFKALSLWERDVNMRGGMLGRKVQLIVYDDGSSPGVAAGLYEHLITRDKVDLVMAPYSSDITAAVLPVTERHGYPVIASGTAEFRKWRKDYSYLFGFFKPSDKYTVGFLEMLTQYGFDEVAIAYTGEAFSVSAANGAREWAGRFGLKTVFFSELGRGPGDALAVARQAKQQRVQALIICGYYNDAVNMRRALKKTGWKPRAFYASVGPTMTAYARRLGKDAELSFSTSQWETKHKLPGARTFSSLFAGAYGAIPTYHAAAAFAAGEILEAAVKKAQTLNREHIRDALASMETMTIMGRFADDRKGGKQLRNFPAIVQIRDGRNRIVWPEQLSGARPVFGK
jgi:branched-chain amino acid transport system substrate-binding protein